MNLKSISGLTLFPDSNPCSYLRFKLPFAEFNKSGKIDARLYDFDNISPEIIKNIVKRNYCIISRDIPNIISKIIINECRKNQQKVFYEIDDNIFEIPETHPYYLYYKIYSGQLKEILKSVDGIIVSTYKLKEALSSYNNNIFLFHNLIPPELEENEPVIKNDNNIILGYAGAYPHYYDMLPIFSVWERLYKEHKKKISFRIIGTVLPEKNIKETNGNVFGNNGCAGTNNKFIESFSESYNFPFDYNLGSPIYKDYLSTLYQSSITIGFSPLLYNNFNRSKSNIKFLEYSMSGIIGIYSDIEAYNEDDIEKILLKKTDENDWYYAAEKIINNLKEYRSKLEISRRRIIKKYSVKNSRFLISDYIKMLENSSYNFKEFIFNIDKICILGNGKLGKKIYELISDLTEIKCVLKNSNDLKPADFDNKTYFLIASHSHFTSIYKILSKYFNESDLTGKIIT